MRVLVIEDNEILSRNIVRYLSSQDIFADLSMTGEDGLRKASTKYYDIVLLDINLPWMDGLEVCQRIREKQIDTSIIMLTLLSSNDDIITGLDQWADDYIPKPFEYEVLLARMNAVIRRKMLNKSNTIIIVDDIELNLQTSELTQDGELIKLSKLEYNLFKYFAQNRNKTLSREEIYKHVWGEYENDFIFSKTIDVYIGYLRKKLGKKIIETKIWYWFIMK